MSSRESNDLDPAIQNQGREDSELCALADSIILECKQSRPTSTIETAICLLRQVLDQRPPPHPLRSDALLRLSTALLTRFNQWGWKVDSDEALMLMAEAIQETMKATKQMPINILEDDDTTAQSGSFEKEEQAEMIQLSFTSLTEFCQSVEGSRIDKAIHSYNDLLLSRSPNNPNRAVTLFKLSDALVMRFHLTGQITDLEEGISRLRKAILLRSPPDPERLRWIISLSALLCMRFSRSGHPQNFREAASLWREAGREDEEASESLSNGMEMIEKFNQSGAVSDLDASVVSLYTSLRLRPDPHPDRCNSLDNLASALSIRFKQKGQLADLEESVALHREALDLLPAPHPDRSISLNNLANVLSTRFEQMGQLTDLEESIALNREVLALFPVPHPNRSNSLNNLASALSTRFKWMGQLADLEESTDLKREALALLPVPHPDRYTALKHLANALLTQCEQTGQLTDLEESISLNREALALTPASHPDRSHSLNNLASALSIRFEQKGQLADLEESIALNREALVLTPVPHLDRSTSLNNLASKLWTRFEQKGELADLEESIDLNREVLVLFPTSHPHRSTSLNNLASAYLMRFEQKGQLTDLEESIAFYREALALRPSPHPDRSTSLNNLAYALVTRFNQKGQLADLEKSIALKREALVLRPSPHPLRSTSLNNLANALLTRFEQKGQLTDLEESIALNREALVLFPAPHSHRCTSLNNLANALSRRFEQKGQLADLEEYMAFHQEALVLRPAPHPDRAHSLNNLGNAYLTRFEKMGQLTDLKESISFYREALVLFPASHPHRSTSLKSLASALLTRFQQMGQLIDLEESMTSFRDASKYETTSVIHRFRSSRLWARRAASVCHSSAMEAYQYAINLLPRLASLDLNIQQRQEALSWARGLACDACSYAVREGHFDKAVEFLSAGRAVFWAQALQLRTPIDDLQSHAPQLADKLLTISRALEAASVHDSPQSTLDDSQQIRDLDREATRCRILNDDWNHTLEEVRQLEGFDDFLQPKSISKLQKASCNGPVVMLNATISSCDALVLVQDRVKHIPLPNISIKVTRVLGVMTQMALLSDWVYSDIFAMANDMLQALPEAIRAGHRHGRPISKAGYTPKDLFEDILGILWLTVAHPIIHGLNLKVKDDLSRIWWCPTGPFSFLPIHAAGIFQDDHQECLSDYAISSYIPTLDALLISPPPKFHEPKMLVVIQPEMPGDSRLSLPYTIRELDMIERHVPKAFLTKLGTREAPTSVERVLSNLPDASFAHFACHGSQDPANPLDSALLLSDGHLKVSTIMQHVIPNASLAFLSACETAKGDENFPDEAIHLAATMLFAGFRGVVGTMWNIYDEDAPEVVDVFYHHIFGTGQAHPDATMAAEALHIAVNKLRKEKKVSFQRWIPFIHLGL